MDLAQVWPGTTATLEIRLVNNDGDPTTSVNINCVHIPSDDQPPSVTIQLENDTFPAGAPSPYDSDLLTNDPAVIGAIADDRGISRLDARVDAGSFQDISSSLLAGQYRFDPTGLPPGPHTITVRATDTAGQFTDAVLAFAVNHAPVANAGGNRTVDEQDAAAFDGSGSSDVEAPLFAHVWTFHDGNIMPGVGASKSYPQDGAYTVVLTVTDTAGSAVSDTIQVAVNNLPAVIDPILDQFGDEGDTISFQSTFHDRGVFDTHTAVVDWGDGSTKPATVQEQNGAGSVSGSHAYGDDGRYTVTITVHDDGGAAASISFAAVIANAAAGGDGRWSECGQRRIAVHTEPVRQRSRSRHHYVLDDRLGRRPGGDRSRQSIIRAQHHADGLNSYTISGDGDG